MKKIYDKIIEIKNYIQNLCPIYWYICKRNTIFFALNLSFILLIMNLYGKLNINNSFNNFLFDTKIIDNLLCNFLKNNIYYHNMLDYLNINKYSEMIIISFIKLGAILAIEFLIGFVFAFILLISVFIVTEYMFSNYINHPQFEIKYSKIVADKIKFYLWYIIVTGLMNIILLMLLPVKFMSYNNIIFIYFIQNPVFYLMLKRSWFNYRIIEKNDIGQQCPI